MGEYTASAHVVWYNRDTLCVCVRSSIKKVDMYVLSLSLFLPPPPPTHTHTHTHTYTHLLAIFTLLQLVAILAFSLVAGYTVNGTTTCNNQISTYIQIQSKFPFFNYDQIVTVQEQPSNRTIRGTPFPQHIISGQFFVAWGVMTMLYCLTAIVVYMLFTANENLERVVDMLIYVVSLKCPRFELV